eukprot:TRINITY_DN50258_c0_g1_i1.p1 TRINITY_DN50258_c0_g1~~TRINITY_DN50258_c0_g1_i1.p1  ORF type:complete len:329 (+),score=63.78 TRINITY_DN50258_c0_g1_i1:71-988(+)
MGPLPLPAASPSHLSMQSLSPLSSSPVSVAPPAAMPEAPGSGPREQGEELTELERLAAEPFPVGPPEGGLCASTCPPPAPADGPQAAAAARPRASLAPTALPPPLPPRKDRDERQRCALCLMNQHQQQQPVAGCRPGPRRSQQRLRSAPAPDDPAVRAWSRARERELAERRAAAAARAEREARWRRVLQNRCGDKDDPEHRAKVAEALRRRAATIAVAGGRPAGGSSQQRPHHDEAAARGGLRPRADGGAMPPPDHSASEWLGWVRPEPLDDGVPYYRRRAGAASRTAGAPPADSWPAWGTGIVG